MANKTDILHGDDIISVQEASKFAHEIKATFHEVSAKNNKGITELFKAVAKKKFEFSSLNLEIGIAKYFRRNEIFFNFVRFLDEKDERTSFQL